MIAFIVALLISHTGMAQQVDETYQACLEAVLGKGYHGGGMQTICEHLYILPSPLLVRCAKAMDENFIVRNESLKPLCRIFCETDHYYGPYTDFPKDELFEKRAKKMEELAAQKRCDEL